MNRSLPPGNNAWSTAIISKSADTWVRCRIFALPFALCLLPFAFCPLPFALCLLPFAFLFLPYIKKALVLQQGLF
jgi:hypothetical protein